MKTRNWEHRPSDHLRGNWSYIHGSKIEPMPQPSWFARLFWRK